MVYVIQDGTAVPSWSCSQSVRKSVWHIPLLGVQWITPDGGQRNCPKHVEFHSPPQKKNWEINAASWLYYTEICHDARLHERKVVKVVMCVWPSWIPNLPHALLRGYIYVSGLFKPVLQQALALEPMFSAHVGKNWNNAQRGISVLFYGTWFNTQ